MWPPAKNRKRFRILTKIDPWNRKGQTEDYILVLKRTVNMYKALIMDEQCRFCEIIRGERKADFVYEDDTLVVFKDVYPAAPVHLLIVPRKHIRSINDLTEEDLLLSALSSLLTFHFLFRLTSPLFHASCLYFLAPSSCLPSSSRFFI